MHSFKLCCCAFNGHCTLPSINANKMSWSFRLPYSLASYSAPVTLSRSLATSLFFALSFALSFWLSLKRIFQFNSIEMSKCSLIYQFVDDNQTALCLDQGKGSCYTILVSFAYNAKDLNNFVYICMGAQLWIKSVCFTHFQICPLYKTDNINSFYTFFLFKFLNLPAISAFLDTF